MQNLPAIQTVGGVAVPCLVLERNRIQFIDFSNGAIGKVLEVPCRNIDMDSTGDAWAVPMKDNGVFTGWWVIPKAFDGQGNDYTINPPTYDSQTCFRVSILNDVHDSIEFYILGSRADFSNSCKSCCGAAYTPMPGVTAGGVKNFTWYIAPTVVIGDIQNQNGQNVTYWGVPTQPAGYKLFPVGSYNDIPFPTPSAGFDNLTTLMAWLNSNAHSVGSPASPILNWTLEGTNVQRIVATGGTTGDVIGFTVQLV